MGKDKDKPRGRTTAYAFFVQTCREEHKKKHPGENVVFAEFSRKCAEKWKSMGAKEKKRFEDMAAKDKIRYDKEMSTYVPPADAKGGKGKKRKHKKDPNAPKRALSGFFFFCNEFRAGVKEENPSYGIGDIAKDLAKKWEGVKNRSKYEELAKKDKARYEKEMAVYKKTGVSPPKKAKPAPKKKAAPPPVEEEEDDDEEEEEEDDEEEEEEDDDDE